MLQCDALKVAHPPCRERRQVGERMTKRKRMVERQKERWQIWVVMRVGGTNSLLKKIKIKAGAQKGQDDSSFKSCQWDYIKKTSLNKAAKFNTGTWQHCTSGRKGEGKVAAVLRRTRGRGCRGRVTLSTARSPSPFHLLIYSLDQHMAPIPALHSACHNALTLIGLMCYSFPLALRRFYLHSTLMSVGSITRAFIFIKMPRHHTKITEITLTTGGFG